MRHYLYRLVIPEPDGTKIVLGCEYDGALGNDALGYFKVTTIGWRARSGFPHKHDAPTCRGCEAHLTLIALRAMR